MNEAHKHFMEQTARDIRHHQRRIKWLKSLPKLDHLQRKLLEQSEFILKNPCHGYNSGPQSDEEEREFLGPSP